MQSYLERYLEGDYASVWAELVALGAGVRNKPVYTDAQGVAQEMMMRTKHNVGLLITRLKVLGYRFWDVDQVWNLPDEKALQALDALEQRYGLIPLVVRKFFEVVGQVDLSGAHPKLSRYEGQNWGGSERLACYSDPMVVCGVSCFHKGLLSFYINLASDWDEMEQMERENPPPYGLDIGLSAINKANHSGIGAIQMIVPSPVFDAPLIDREDYWMGTFFIPYLRSCFKWGGFPGLSRLPEPDRPNDELHFLTQDLLTL